MATEAYAVLSITGQTLTPAQISLRAGLEADRAWTKGEQRVTHEAYKGPPVYEEQNRWKVQSDLARDEPVEAHVAELIARVAPFADRIKELADETEVTLACAIYADSEGDHNPEVFLSSDTVAFLGTLGANFWVDFYFLSGAEEAH